MISLSLPDLSETKASKQLMERAMKQGIGKGMKLGIERRIEKGALAGIIREYESLMDLEPTSNESLVNQSKRRRC